MRAGSESGIVGGLFRLLAPRSQVPASTMRLSRWSDIDQVGCGETGP